MGWKSDSEIWRKDKNVGARERICNKLNRREMDKIKREGDGSTDEEEDKEEEKADGRQRLVGQGVHDKKEGSKEKL